ncbi:MAG: cell division protein FtsW [Rhodobacteraceae bacterium]|nr:MAG: cell division protein FtsW [Paracoccaceae bacterium]
MTEMTFGARPERAAQPFDGAILERWWRSVDQWSLWAIGGLFLIGMVTGLAASPPLADRLGLPHFYFVTRQAVFGVAALGLMALVSMATPAQVRRVSVIGFGVWFVAILLLPFFGTDFGKGAVRWFSFGVGSVQPSEFLKPFFAVFGAWLLSASADENGPPGALLSFLVTTAVAACLALQPDFGQAALILAIWGAMYFVAGAPVALFVGLAGAVGAVGWAAYSSSAHFARRIDAFLAADVEPLTQLGFATDAIRAGGLFGVGVGEGTVKWSLPDAHTDFIIAVVAEEYGLFAVLLILALYTFIVARAALRLLGETDAFIRLAGLGLAVLFGLQALVNMGVAIRLFPAKGMTLPLISYGGSSVLAVGFGLGMLLALTRRRRGGPA